MTEIIFYGGIILLAAAVVLSAVALAFFKRAKIKLNARFDAEYGKEDH
jgi:hypothetical protein